FFQAEDGIRDFHVTGVQTCALPIYSRRCAARPTGTGVQQESRRPSSPWKPRLSRAESHSAIREGWSTGGALDALFAARCLLWTGPGGEGFPPCSRSEEHTSELQSRENLVCRLLLEKKKTKMMTDRTCYTS